MARLKLVRYPNPTLRAPNFEVAFPLSRETRELVDQMMYSCKRFHGIGLAAPQIGHNLNLAVINLEEYQIPPFAILNPKIISSSSKSHIMEEGCLSIPGKFGSLKRPEKVTVKFITIEGKEMKLSVDGLLAVVFQHEIDHLGGVLICDKWDINTVHTLDESELARARKKRKKQTTR